MTSTEVLTLRLDRTVSRRLTSLAASTDRARERLAAEAIERSLDENAWQIEAIEEGIRAAGAGSMVRHEEVRKWVRRWRKTSSSKSPNTKR